LPIHGNTVIIKADRQTAPKTLAKRAGKQLAKDIALRLQIVSDFLKKDKVEQEKPDAQS
jgi:hypothetical protein